MKQVQITEVIRQRLTAAGATPDTVMVYEASALSTRPVRKQHPLYLGARHTRNFLQEMSAALAGESLPLQIMHDGSELPIGRIFYSEVYDNDMGGSELRVQFWVDEQHSDKARLIDSGTVNQVSVSVLGKSAKCSACSFDFFGETATLDNIWMGVCEEGHVIGEDDVHVVLNDLASWFEMSLVNRGGAVGAFIHDRENQRLAASGNPLHMLALQLSDNSESSPMDMTKLIQDLTNAQAQVITLTAAAAGKEVELAALTAKIDELQQKLDAAIAVASAADADKAEKDILAAALSDATKHILAMKGDATTKVEGAPEAILALLKDSTKDLKLVAATAAGAASADAGDKKPVAKMSSAFKRAH